jgi:phage terminase large subunit
MNVTNVFERNLKALSDGNDVIVNQGGSSSSKTYSILQLILLIARTRKNKTISVVSETFPHLKRGAIKDWENILVNDNLLHAGMHNKSNHTYRIGTSTVEFFSADSPDRIRGARRDYLFVNECNNISWETFDQLEIRTDVASFIDFNPVAEFWANERVIGEPKVAFIKSTFLDNPHLSEKIVTGLLKRREKDPNWWRVYGLGEVGQLEGTIYRDWKQVPAESFPHDSDKCCYGLDFGFTNDPTTLVKTGTRDGELYARQIFYEDRMEQHGLRKGFDEIWADSAEPKSIAELRSYGWNIRGVIKGQDSVRQGINLVKQFKLNVTSDSIELIKELRNYSWSMDPKTGKYYNTPAGIWDHCLDALRYSVMMKHGRAKAPTVRQVN